jgi:hypothetical protein
MLNHLVSPQEPMLAASMAGWMLTVDHRSRSSRVYSGYVSLKVGFPFKSLVLASTRFLEAVVE